MTTKCLHLLIVDDEAAHVAAIRRAFDEAGGHVEIESVASLHAFRVSVVARKPDLALVDLNLPDGRAVEVLQHPPEDAPFPVIVMTAFGNQQIVVEVLKAGALDYLVKSPATFATMPRTVEHALREWDLLQKHKQAAAALRESEARFRSLLQSVPTVAVQGYGPDGTTRYWNQASARLYGYTAQEAIGRNLLDLIIPPEMRPDVQRAMQEIARTGQPIPAAELSLQCKDGSRVTVFSSHAIVQAPGREPELFCIDVDLTERKRAEEARQQSERNYREIFNAANDAIYVHDADTGEVLDVNDAMLQLFGFTREEALRLTPDITSLGLPPYSAAEARQWMAKAVAEGPQVFEWHACKKDGAPFWVEVALKSATISGRRCILAVVRDITERKRADDTIRQMAQRFQAILNKQHYGILVVSDADRVEFVNQAFCDFMGLAASRPESYLGMAAEQMMSKVLPAYADPAATLARIQAVVASDEPTFDNEIPMRDGRVLLVDFLPLLIEGHNTGRLWLHRDITERKRTETALRGSEARLVSAQAVAHIGSWELNLATRTMWASAEAVRIYGYEQVQEELLLEAVQQRVVAEDRPAMDAALRALVESGHPYDQTYRIIRAGDGTQRVIHSRASLECDAEGRPLKVVGTLQDITEHTQVHAAQARLATAVAQAAETIVITDPSGAIVYANPAFEKVTGYACQAVLGQNPRLLKSGKHDAAFYRQLWATLSAGQVWSGRLVNKCKDGRLIEEDATISPVLDANGKLINYVAVKRDITREVALEMQNRQAAKMEAVGQLAGGVAHDFNNKLQIILGCAEVIMDSLPADHPIRADLQEIQQAAGHSAELTRQLLAFSRKQLITPVLLDLNTALSGSLRMLSRLIGENIRLTFTVSRDAQYVFMDPAQVDQILANLALNARDAIAGTGTITITVTNQTLGEADCRDRPEFVTPGEYVIVTICDDGAGMTPELQAHIFEPFFTTKGVGKGTGLGLATVYGIVKQNNGAITVQSAPGQGSRFTLYLPRANKATPAAANETALPHKPTGTETILVVEDEESVLSLVQRTLTQQGYKVLTAAHPRVAVQLCAQHPEPIHLLLTDVIMPDMGGKQLAEYIQQQRPGIRVLFMSGYTADIMMHQGHLQEDLPVLQKPFLAADLTQRVRTTLDAPLTPGTPP